MHGNGGHDSHCVHQKVNIYAQVPSSRSVLGENANSFHFGLTFASLGALVIRVLFRRVSALLVPASPGSAAITFSIAGDCALGTSRTTNCHSHTTS